jgi:hypothetical protein
VKSLDAFALGIVTSSFVAAIVTTAIFAPMMLAAMLAFLLFIWAVKRVIDLAMDRGWL